jgi:phosphoribosyl 1,2-cyclic phosphodiesterase
MNAFVCSLASGSLGNALLVSTDRVRLLVDCGLSRRRLKAALAAAGAAPEDIRGVLLTHTHHDHFSSSAAAFCRARGIPVYSTEDNLAHLAYDLGGFAELVASGLAQPIDGEPLHIGNVTVEAFPVPHDSAGQCLGFRLTMGGPHRRRAVAVATDLGHMPAACLPAFLDADAVVLESNHDPRLLRESGRPPDLIERIAGLHGHLSNGACAEALAEIAGRSHPGRLRSVTLAHLSRDCNRPRLALAAQAPLAKNSSHPIRFTAASQEDVGPSIEL